MHSHVDGGGRAAVITGAGWRRDLKCRGLISSADDIEDISVNEHHRREAQNGELLIRHIRRVASRSGLVRQRSPSSRSKLTSAQAASMWRTIVKQRGDPTGGTSAAQRVDKAAGWLLYEGADPAASCFYLRRAGAWSKALAGIPFIASVSAPTADGVAAARAANITMIGFARGGGFNIYSADGRVELAEKEL
ncbi:MAG: formate dehydrogenase accessory sulfurtransferase FdhD [Cloacibacillus evryensis]